MMVLLLFVFAAYKFAVLVEMRDYTLKREVKEHFLYGRNNTFGTQDGFSVAANVFSLEGGALQVIEDERIGTLKFYNKTWSQADGSDFAFYELPHR